MVCRIGSVELALIRRRRLALRLGVQPEVVLRGGLLDDCLDLAGVFPRTGWNASLAADRLWTDLQTADLVAVWNNFGEAKLLREAGISGESTFPLRSLEPYFSKQPWTGELEGKRILVVHPFARTIESQYRRRERLFDREKVLPPFELSVLPAVQSIGGTADRFRDWSSALDFMAEEVDRSEADVVLIAAGAYGLPLAATAKRSGKIGIHWGGSLQLLFGIMGRRWENHEVFGRLANDAWTRPSLEETPDGAMAVEGGCYW
jgi:hypothetical protein